MVVESWIQRLIDQTTFSAAADSADAGEGSEWNFYRNIFEIVPSCSGQADAFSIAFSKRSYAIGFNK